MSIKETADRMKKTVQEITRDMRGVTSAFTQSVPRPIIDRLAERPTMLFKQPLLKTLKEKRGQ